MRPGQRAALVAVADRFADIPFRVGGSCMLALLGEDVAVGDIDIMVDDADEDRVMAAVAGWVHRVVAGGSHPHVVSRWLIDAEVTGEAVEVMGGLALRSDGAEWRLPMRMGPTVDVEGRVVPLAAIGPWVALYTLYKPARAEALARWLTDDEVSLTASEVPPGLGIEWPPATLLPPPRRSP
jgi:hypothetical protein